MESRHCLAHSDHRLNDMKCGSRLKKSKRFEKLTTFDDIRKAINETEKETYVWACHRSATYGFTLAVCDYIPIYMETNTHMFRADETIIYILSMIA